MGKNLIQQRRGKGTFVSRTPNHRYAGKTTYSQISEGGVEGKITDIKHCPAHSAPLLEISLGSGKKIFMIAPEEKRVGDIITFGNETNMSSGNVLSLKSIPEGTEIFNIESNPGDGGKFVKAGGNFARIVSKGKDSVTVLLPSKKKKKFNINCRATIGRVAGTGRLEKPLLKAGKAFHKSRAVNNRWPVVRGKAMNAVAHPHGGKRSSKNFTLIVPRSAPPGAKVGKVAARKTGKRK